MYYIGTKEQCEAYNQKVTEREEYLGTTVAWAQIRKHPTKNLWSIPKHLDYASEMEYAWNLSDDWFKDENI